MKNTTTLTKDENSIVVSRTEIKRNELGQIVKKLSFDSNNKLFQIDEYFYDDNNREIKLVKGFPQKDRFITFEYKYNSEGKYIEIMQTTFATKIEKKCIKEFQDGKLIKKVEDIYKTNHIKRVIDTTQKTTVVVNNEQINLNQKEEVYLNDELVNKNGEYINFREFLKNGCKDKITFNNELYLKDYSNFYCYLAEELLDLIKTGNLCVKENELLENMKTKYGVDIKTQLQKLLCDIANLCHSKLNLPILSAIVVDNETQLPSTDFFKLYDELKNTTYLGNRELEIKCFDEIKQEILNCKNFNKLKEYLNCCR